MISAALAKYLTAAELVRYLADEQGGDCFVAHMPDQPDEAVAIMPGSGMENATRHGGDIATVQLIIRGAPHDPRPPLQRAQTLLRHLDCLPARWFDEDGTDAVWISGITAAHAEPAPMGVDANDRHEWSVNFRIHAHQPTANRQH